MNNKYLDFHKIGDEVVYRDLGYRIATIVRETKTLWILDDGKRCKKDAGMISKVKSLDEKNKLLKEKEERALKKKLKKEYSDLWRRFAYRMKGSWEKLSLEQLREIKKIIDEY